jgi:16S rRNA (cytosine967-C5)-methyltransferase
VIRWKGYLNALLSSFAEKDIKKDTQYLLWMSLYQLLFMRKAHYHVVKEAVEYAKEHSGQHIANFVNAVLRRFLREKQGLIAGPSGHVEKAALLQSFPDWLVRRWSRRFGEDQTEVLLRFYNAPPRFTLRIDLRRIARRAVAEHFESKGIQTDTGTYLESALWVDRLMPILRDKLFKEGLISIQDETSQVAGLSVQPRDGERILDACAGLGTKTSQLRELAGEAVIVSMDRDVKRLKMIKEKKDVVLGDATHPPFRGEVFDSILVDAPCSSLGIIRRHPEIKWRRREKDIISFGHSQSELLKALWGNLKPGGRMIYSVCSFEAEETTDVIDDLRKDREFMLENPYPFLFNKEYFLSIPHETGLDGFFIARLKKI